MAINVPITWANPDPNANPLTVQQLRDILATLTTAQIADPLNFYVISSTTPAVDQQALAWVRLDSAGRPLGTYVYHSGLWVRERPPVSGLFGYYVGDPSVDFDGTGLGLPGPGPVALDFFGWALMNGNNGTANLSDRFIILGRMDNSGITGYLAGTGWRTNIDGVAEHTGGVANITLDTTNTYRPATDALNVGTFTADGNARQDGGDLFGPYNSIHPSSELIPADAGNPTPPAIPTVPNFYAFAMIQWISYPP